MTKKAVAERKVDGATAVLNVLREVARSQYNNWFPSVPPIQPAAAMAAGQVAVRPALSFLVAGYEEGGAPKTPRLYGLDSFSDFSPMLHDYGFAVQGIAQYALYLLNRLYESDRTIEELIPLAVYVITETASQDGKVGGPVNVITIEAGDRGCQRMTPDAVQKIQEANASRSKVLRDSFYKKAGVA